MNSLTLKSPAKINLLLRVLRRRSDGYHDLATLFHRISLADTLKLRKKKQGIELRCSDASLPTDERNLVVKAYRLLQERFPKLGGVSVFLKKQIPVGAGLGGGSSNAAYFLMGMKKLYRLPVSQAELLKIGAGLGADIPFFIHNINQGIGIGRGDRIQSKVSQTRHYFVLAASAQSLSTREVYENLKGKIRPLVLTKVSRCITMLCEFLAKKKYAQIEPLLCNDLERSAFELKPALRNVITVFKKQGITLTRMTGSGPTVFGFLPQLHGSKLILKALQKELPSHRIISCSTY